MMKTPQDAILAAVFQTGLMIHKRLGPGLFESVYEAILVHELVKAGFRVEQQVEVPLEWDSVVFEKSFRADLVIDGIVVLEIKASETKHPVHARQLLTYLKLMDKRLGAVVNFGLETFKDGFERVANGMPN